MKKEGVVALAAVLFFLTCPILMAQGRDGSPPGTSLGVDTTSPPPDLLPVEKEPEIIRQAVPVYPEAAVRKGLQGRVLVKVSIDSGGKPDKAEILRSDNSIFNKPSIDAAMKYRFTPAIMDGKPIAVWVVIPFNFKLKPSSPSAKDSIAMKSDSLEVRTLRYAPHAQDSSKAPPEYVPADKQPRIVRRALPVYPAAVLKDSIEAKLIVKVWVDTAGKPQQVVVLKRLFWSAGAEVPVQGTLAHSYIVSRGKRLDAALFDLPTMEAAMRYKFTPAIMSGKPVAVWVVMAFVYRADGTCSAPSTNENVK